MEDAEWESLAEIEAVQSFLHKVIPIVQNKTLHMGSLLYSIRVNCMQTHITDKVPILRKTKIVDEFSETCKMCVKRAILEGEKRFCGNDKNKLKVIDTCQATHCILIPDPDTL